MKLGLILALSAAVLAKPKKKCDDVYDYVCFNLFLPRDFTPSSHHRVEFPNPICCAMTLSFSPSPPTQSIEFTKPKLARALPLIPVLPSSRS